MFERAREVMSSRRRYALHIETGIPRDELSMKLREYEPWRHEIIFSNGVSTAEFEKGTPFSRNPLQKLALVERSIPFEDLRGGSLLDVGCNSGYNSIHASRMYGMKTVGIDVSQRHIEVSRFLAGLAGLDCDFRQASAEEFFDPGSFDVVLHFGTLYHLQNPLRALEMSYKSLKPGGYLALETQVYEHADDPNICYFMHMHNNDRTNFWALSPSVLEKSLSIVGFSDVAKVKTVKVAGLAPGMARSVVVARRPPKDA